MEEERVVHLLHELPLQRASAGFTTRVLRRLDETPASRSAAPRGMRRLDRLMVATATVAALGLSITLLQRERAGGPLAAGLASAHTAAIANSANLAARAAGGRLAATLQGQPERRLAPQRLAFGASPAAGPAALQANFVQARAMLRQLRQESGRLERDLHSLRGSGGSSGSSGSRFSRSAAAPASASSIYLGGDESVDLVLTPARIRARQPAPDPADRDDGELNYSL
jgi:hypothetical protein